MVHWLSLDTLRKDGLDIVWCISYYFVLPCQQEPNSLSVEQPVFSLAMSGLVTCHTAIGKDQRVCSNWCISVIYLIFHHRNIYPVSLHWWVVALMQTSPGWPLILWLDKWELLNIMWAHVTWPITLIERTVTIVKHPNRAITLMHTKVL